MLYAKTQCAKVEDNAVTATGTFAELIAPASPFKEGFSRGPGQDRVRGI
jgi:hypothetical protein